MSRRVVALVGCLLGCAGLVLFTSEVRATRDADSRALAERHAVAELREVRLFAEPLRPAGGEPSAAENGELQLAVEEFGRRRAADDFSALDNFVVLHPRSPWTPALLLNLGLEYYTTGWYSKALAAWERSWSLLKAVTDPVAKQLADRAAGELAFMYGRLGRMKELQALLREVEGRTFTGPATEKIVGAREGLWTMRHRPEIGFRCGPFALDRILASQKATNTGCALIHGSKSTTNGFSLTEVAALSRELGMNYQMAFRAKGAELIVPAVVNWKVGHYAALVRREGDLFLLQDPTFGNDTWASRRTLDEEASGYFLVPPGLLPKGWRAVSDEEGKQVFGKGSTSNKENTANSKYDKTKCPPKSGGGSPSAMAVANTHLMLVSLNLEDSPVGYTPPVGPPVLTTVTYNQREISQPGAFNYVNLGPKWTFNWLAYIQDNPLTPLADVTYFTDAGGALLFSGFNSGSQTFAREVKSQALLKRTSTNSYELSFNNGERIIFDQPSCTNCTTRRVFMTQKFDPQGNALTISYDANFRVASVTDAIGQVTTFSYENGSDFRKLTKVTDPFGRFATFSYDLSGRLTNITDVIGINSQFTYDAGDFVSAMTTPYGTTTFEKGENGPQRWLVTTYPNGDKDRVEFFESAYIGVPNAEPVIPSGMVVANTYLIYRNSFYWDAKAYAEAAGDYTKAHLYHWLHYASGVAAAVMESEKAPFENRVWYRYDGQGAAYNYGTTDQPYAIGRVLDDGSTQLLRFGYDSAGNVTNVIDPAGRSLTFVYSTNQIDLLEVRQTSGGHNDLLAQIVYNAQHLPIASRDAAGQWTTNTFNARGQLLSTRNPLGEITAFAYDADELLLSVDGPLAGTNDTVRFSYDSMKRVRAITDVDGFTITNSYDNLDRLTNVAFPDGTFMAFTYDKLDRVKTRDRLGRETQFTYDSLRRLTSVRDALNRLVRLEYCGCGSVAALIDQLGRATHWEYDLQGRVTAKQFPDGSRMQFTYENTTSRLKTIRDEKGQIINCDYYADDSIRRVSYPAAEFPTPQIAYGYDAYGRLQTMQDAIGTTTWAYVPAGSPGALAVASVDGPWANDTITYQYDTLGRATNRALNGVARSLAFDPLGRVTNVVNALGSFGVAYDGPSTRALDEIFPNGQTTHYDYFAAGAGRRLQGITHRKPDTSMISRFLYAPNAAGSLTNWTQELGVVTNQWSADYDAVNQLLNVAVAQGTSNFTHSYSYDLAGNRSAESAASSNRTFHYNALNQLVSSSDNTLTNVTFEWDAEHRLLAVVSGANRTEFAYDGLGRRCRIVEKTNGVVESERRYVWCDVELCEERDGADVVLQRFFDEGFTSGGANYFYTRDHLGSVREVLDAAGVVQSRYAYDPFGARTVLLENVPAPFGFTGHFRHARSGLSLAYWRTYDNRFARWLSRDPLGEAGGVNLYGYVENDPLNLVDPLGACSRQWDKLLDASKQFGAGSGYLGGLWGLGIGKAGYYGWQGYQLLQPRTWIRGWQQLRAMYYAKRAEIIARIHWTREFIHWWRLRRWDMTEQMSNDAFKDWLKDAAKDEIKEAASELADNAYDWAMQEAANRSVQNYRDSWKSLTDFFNKKNCGCP